MNSFEWRWNRLSNFVHSIQGFDLEMVVINSEEAVTRFANNEISQNVTERNTEAIQRIVENQRSVVVQINDLDIKKVREYVAKGREAARLVPPLDVYPGLSRPSRLRATRCYDPAIARFTAAKRADWVRTFVARARSEGLVASGAISTSRATFGYINSQGVSYVSDASRVSVELILYDATGSGYATATGLSATAIDPEALAKDAAWRAIASRHPIQLPPGEYPVLLEPPAVADLLEFAGWSGFNAKMIEDHQSFLEDTLGKQAVSPLITLVEDPFSEKNPGLPFDFEGTPRKRVILIEKGVIRSAVYDRRTGKKAGKKSTGNALPPNYGIGPIPLNMELKPGQMPRAELLRKVDRGILVTRFHYTNIVEPRKLILTGMTRDGTFEIRNGEIAKGIKNMRFTQNIVQAFKGVEGVSREQSLISFWFSGTLVPSVLLNNFRFTSATLF